MATTTRTRKTINPKPKAVPVLSDEAVRYARAVTATTERYLTNCMARATWRDHMGSLWGTIEALDLTDDVVAVVPREASALFVGVR